MDRHNPCMGAQGDTASVDFPDVESAEEAPRLDVWTKDQGFPDSYGVLRIWLDNDDLITRVLLTPYWREKLSEQPLSAAFHSAFMLINNHRLNEPTPCLGSLLHEPTTVPLMDESAIEALWQRSVEIRERLTQFSTDEALGRWEGEGSVGTAANGDVCLYLDLHGKLADIKFSEKWLTNTSARRVGLCVVQAHRDAWEKWREPVYIPGPADEFADETRRLLNDSWALANGDLSWSSAIE